MDNIESIIGKNDAKALKAFAVKRAVHVDSFNGTKCTLNYLTTKGTIDKYDDPSKCQELVDFVKGYNGTKVESASESYREGQYCAYHKY